MKVTPRLFAGLALLACSLSALAADWPGFRGPNGNGSCDDKNLPVEWSKDNILWKVKLPGLGSSSPITAADKVFVTCYSGYGTKLTKGFGKGGKGGGKGEDPGDQKKLRLHLVCLDRDKGAVLWTKEIEPKLPERAFTGYIREHGYASSTPVTDGERVHVFFGKTGVFAFDLNGNQQWHADVGSETDAWGSASSPALTKNTVVINAAIESRSVVGLDKKTGKELWRKKGISKCWISPVVVELAGGKQEVVLNAPGKIMALDPDSGAELWHCKGIGGGEYGYTCSTPAIHKDVVYAMGAGPGVPATIIAVRAGGSGDVTESRILWKQKAGTSIASPTVHDGRIYWVAGRVYCLSADKGDILYQEPLYDNRAEYTSAVIADGKIFALTRFDGLFVLAEGKKFTKLAHNTFEGDDSIFNSSPAISNGRLYIRSNAYLYCVGKK